MKLARTTTLLALAILSSGCVGDRPEEGREDAPPRATTPALQANRVPRHLQHLVPLAERWGIGDNVERALYIEQATPADRQALVNAVTPHQETITTWLDSFGTRPLTDEAAAFMYMQLAIEKMEL